MRRLRAAWRAFRDPEPQVVVSPEVVKIRDVVLSREMSRAIRDAIARVNREEGKR